LENFPPDTVPAVAEPNAVTSLRSSTPNPVQAAEQVELIDEETARVFRSLFGRHYR
jgi:hypothetical protein